MTWLTDVGLFGLLFFLLVFSHELGHFLMARWMGVRVERFAVGMGPKLIGFTRGPTEFKICLLPLGGYVKMAGDDPTKEYSSERTPDGFLGKKPPQKLLIVLGGPLFNFIFPIFIFALMLPLGIPTVEPIVGTMEPGRPAAEAGLVPGDRILSVDGKPIRKFSEIESVVDRSLGKNLQLEIERVNLNSGEKEKVQLAVEPKMAKTKSKFGEDIEAPRIGASPEYIVPLIFFESEESIVGRAGFQNFDRVTKINNVEIRTQSQMDAVLASLKPSDVTLTVDRNGSAISKTFTLSPGTADVATRIGLVSVSRVIGRVEPGSPAERAGLQANDVMVSIDSKPIQNWEDIATVIRASEGKPVSVVWSRNGQQIKAEMAPEKTTIDDPLLGKDNPLAREPMYRIGIGAALRSETGLYVERSWNPIQWVARGFTESWNMGRTTVEALYKLFTGQVSLKLLGSPIMIYKVAGHSYRLAGGGAYGWYSFFSNLAMLSITLGLVNLLPIPVLDGGHATFFIIEWIRGRPVSLRFMEIAMQVGLFILISLFALVLYNDFSRYGWLDAIVQVFK